MQNQRGAAHGLQQSKEILPDASQPHQNHHYVDTAEWNDLQLPRSGPLRSRSTCPQHETLPNQHKIPS
ncbi:unnamed protein product, partial [Brassica oleracea]